MCSEREGSVVNLDLEDAISWSFHFMIYIAVFGGWGGWVDGDELEERGEVGVWVGLELGLCSCVG